ncbi:hypothetical protein BDV35DRAFT_340127 [Aspergillus flavus]|uniref:Uncharacterized protein n=1 Tax=Aspergillus flavus TaxID=5059 RepID=A0A5N6HA57_ASPFL|nr:hypothetical protein BDV35DRAFT_340127 [Aspergillus flavus]
MLSMCHWTSLAQVPPAFRLLRQSLVKALRHWLRGPKRIGILHGTVYCVYSIPSRRGSTVPWKLLFTSFGTDFS